MSKEKKDEGYYNPVPDWALNPKYPRQGSYTLADYMALPDDQRVELIDGVIYDMSAPLAVHQLIQRELLVRFSVESGKHSGKCQAFDAPFDVQLDKDDRTIVQPDVMVICHPEIITKQRVVGSPDLVIEILSPSTRRKDFELKYGKYAHAHVREYWMVDPQRQRIYVNIFDEVDIMHVYTFDDKVPVWISGGSFSIDFSEIKQKIDELGLSESGDDDK